MKRIFALALGVYLLSSYPSFAQEGLPTSLMVNGQSVSTGVVLGSTGGDWAVMVSPILRATGAKVQTSNNHLEALWNDNSSLLLEVGRSTCTYQGRSIALNTPCGLADGDLVMPLGDLCNIIGATVTMGEEKNLVIARGVVFSAGIPEGYAPSNAIGRNFPEAGAGGLTSKVENANSPYDRPEVSIANLGTSNYTLETPRSADSFSIYSNQNMANANGGYGAGNMGVDQFGLPLGMSVAQNNYMASGAMGNSSANGYMNTMTSPMGASMRGYGMTMPTNNNSMNYQANSNMGNLAVPNMANGMGAGNTSSIAPGMFNKSGLMGNMGMASSLPNNSSNDGVRYYEPNISMVDRPENFDESGQPIFSPAKIVISEFDVQRLMSFHLTAYELRARIKNEGQLPNDKPFQLQLLAKSKRYDHYELLESYQINPLQPGAEVEVVKKVDGHQFTCLVDLTIDFRVAVLESLPVKNSETRNSRLNRQERNKPKATANETPLRYELKETCSKKKTMRY